MQTKKMTSLMLRETGLPLFRRRSGLSLIEILASLFVIAIGMLGVLAALPFGLYYQEKINIRDYGSACGLAATAQIRTGDWQKLNTNVLLTDNTFLMGAELPFNPGSGNNDPNANDGVFRQYADPYIVDPLGFSQGNKTASFQRFPVMINPNYQTGSLNLCRFSVQHPKVYRTDNGKDSETWNTTDAERVERMLTNNFAWANNMFRWQDDLLFAPKSNNDTTDRPELILVNKYKNATGSSSGSGQEAAAAEQYSYMFMVTPIVRPADVVRFKPGTSNNIYGWAQPDDVARMEVSTIVFRQRSLPLDATVPSERLLKARVSGSFNTSVNLTLLADSQEELDVSTINWILLTGVSEEYNQSGGANGTIIARWYRIAGTTDIETVDASDNTDPDAGNFAFRRNLFLIGPGWDGQPDSSDANQKTAGMINAVLCDGVIHVKTETMPK